MNLYGSFSEKLDGGKKLDTKLKYLFLYVMSVEKSHSELAVSSLVIYSLTPNNIYKKIKRNLKMSFVYLDE